MKNEISLGKIMKELGDDSSVLLEHMERTEWKERRIIVYAKSAALVILVLGVMIAFCIGACRAENTLEMMKILMPVVSGVLSFLAGRVSR